ncbi:conserved Plasmodium protein, unknown function [Plasmodium ovale]|uniref:Uncharacterized protein n=2 Tax=Plasmodium ovale TaxID=36330 RepID=A0A1A8WLB9_PLAOA|nr:conserved Plasmodium protein, unknown function [Plasmodium ovale curtisi]SBS93709.1 conserved Plasmodium protein, unknown function [Plasmodium ovale curtisi]SCP04908.1 conserved Plasmodium protein, unknown function [Plasmodium ovale]
MDDTYKKENANMSNSREVEGDNFVQNSKGNDIISKGNKVPKNSKANNEVNLNENTNMYNSDYNNMCNIKYRTSNSKESGNKKLEINESLKKGNENNNAEKNFNFNFGKSHKNNINKNYNKNFPNDMKKNRNNYVSTNLKSTEDVNSVANFNEQGVIRNSNESVEYLNCNKTNYGLNSRSDLLENMNTNKDIDNAAHDFSKKCAVIPDGNDGASKVKNNCVYNKVSNLNNLNNGSNVNNMNKNRGDSHDPLNKRINMNSFSKSGTIKFNSATRFNSTNNNLLKNHNSKKKLKNMNNLLPSEVNTNTEKIHSTLRRNFHVKDFTAFECTTKKESNLDSLTYGIDNCNGGKSHTRPKDNEKNNCKLDPKMNNGNNIVHTNTIRGNKENILEISPSSGNHISSHDVKKHYSTTNNNTNVSNNGKKNNSIETTDSREDYYNVANNDRNSKSGINLDDEEDHVENVTDHDSDIYEKLFEEGAIMQGSFIRDKNYKQNKFMKGKNLNYLGYGNDIGKPFYFHHGNHAKKGRYRMKNSNNEQFKIYSNDYLLFRNRDNNFNNDMNDYIELMNKNFKYSNASVESNAKDVKPDCTTDSTIYTNNIMNAHKNMEEENDEMLQNLHYYESVHEHQNEHGRENEHENMNMMQRNYDDVFNRNLNLYCSKENRASINYFEKNSEYGDPSQLQKNFEYSMNLNPDKSMSFLNFDDTGAEWKCNPMNDYFSCKENDPLSSTISYEKMTLNGVLDFEGRGEYSLNDGNGVYNRENSDSINCDNGIIDKDGTSRRGNNVSTKKANSSGDVICSNNKISCTRGDIHSDVHSDLRSDARSDICSNSGAVFPFSTYNMSGNFDRLSNFALGIQNNEHCNNALEKNRSNALYNDNHGLGLHFGENVYDKSGKCTHVENINARNSDTICSNLNNDENHITNSDLTLMDDHNLGFTNGDNFVDNLLGNHTNKNAFGYSNDPSFAYMKNKNEHSRNYPDERNSFALPVHFECFKKKENCNDISKVGKKHCVPKKSKSNLHASRKENVDVGDLCNSSSGSSSDSTSSSFKENKNGIISKTTKKDNSATRAITTITAATSATSSAVAPPSNNDVDVAKEGATSNRNASGRRKKGALTLNTDKSSSNYKNDEGIGGVRGGGDIGCTNGRSACDGVGGEINYENVVCSGISRKFSSNDKGGESSRNPNDQMLNVSNISNYSTNSTNSTSSKSSKRKCKKNISGSNGSNDNEVICGDSNYGSGSGLTMHNGSNEMVGENGNDINLNVLNEQRIKVADFSDNFLHYEQVKFNNYTLKSGMESSDNRSKNNDFLKFPSNNLINSKFHECADNNAYVNSIYNSNRNEGTNDQSSYAQVINVGNDNEDNDNGDYFGEGGETGSGNSRCNNSISNGHNKVRDLDDNMHYGNLMNEDNLHVCPNNMKDVINLDRGFFNTPDFFTASNNNYSYNENMEKKEAYHLPITNNPLECNGDINLVTIDKEIIDPIFCFNNEKNVKSGYIVNRENFNIINNHLGTNKNAEMIFNMNRKLGNCVLNNGHDIYHNVSNKGGIYNYSDENAFYNMNMNHTQNVLYKNMGNLDNLNAHMDGNPVNMCIYNQIRAMEEKGNGNVCGSVGVTGSAGGGNNENHLLLVDNDECVMSNIEDVLYNEVNNLQHHEVKYGNSEDNANLCDGLVENDKLGCDINRIENNMEFLLHDKNSNCDPDHGHEHHQHENDNLRGCVVGNVNGNSSGSVHGNVSGSVHGNVSSNVHGNTNEDTCRDHEELNIHAKCFMTNDKITELQNIINSLKFKNRQLEKELTEVKNMHLKKKQNMILNSLSNKNDDMSSYSTYKDDTNNSDCGSIDNANKYIQNILNDKEKYNYDTKISIQKFHLAYTNNSIGKLKIAAQRDISGSFMGPKGIHVKTIKSSLHISVYKSAKDVWFPGFADSHVFLLKGNIFGILRACQLLYHYVKSKMSSSKCCIYLVAPFECVQKLLADGCKRMAIIKEECGADVRLGNLYVQVHEGFTERLMEIRGNEVSVDCALEKLVIFMQSCFSVQSYDYELLKYPCRSVLNLQ